MYKVKRNFLVIICVLLILLFSGCRTGSIQDITIEDFDLDIAKGMIQELERPILHLTSGAIFTRSELEELHRYEIFSNDMIGPRALSSFFDFGEWYDMPYDMSVEEFEVLEHSRFLTIFDDDIDVTRAYIETTTFYGRDIADARVELHIVLEYIGEDADMLHLNNRDFGNKGFSYMRSYIFIPDETGGWMLNPIGTPITGWAIFAFRSDSDT